MSITENIDMLFQAFHSTKPEGMGIGLSVSRSILESHKKGRIWAEREARRSRRLLWLSDPKA